MGILDSIKNVTGLGGRDNASSNKKNLFIEKDSEKNVYPNQSSESDERDLKKKHTIRLTFKRDKQDIKSWREAVIEMENAYFPHRVKVQRLFKDTIIDGHVFACYEKRKDLTLLKKWEIQNEKGEADEYWTEIFSKEWASRTSSYALDALFFAYNLIYYEEIEKNIPKGVHILPRQNVSPDRENITSIPYNIGGKSINDEDIKNWLFYVSTPSMDGDSKVGLGLLYYVAKYEIMLRNIFGYNGDFVELYSQPYRIVKTSKENEERQALMDDLIEAGSNSIAILDFEDEISFLESKGSGNGWQGYENFELRMQKIISKIILGHADAIDSTSGKLGSNEEVKEALGNKEKKDVDFLLTFWNDNALPKLRNQGLNIPDNYKFAFCNDKEKEEAKTKQISDNKTIVETLSKLKDAGYKVKNIKQLEEMTGFELEEIIEVQESVINPVLNGGKKENEDQDEEIEEDENEENTPESIKQKLTNLYSNGRI